LALENPKESCEATIRKMAQEILDLFVFIANRLSLGELRRRLGAVSKLSFVPISMLTEKFNPQNTPCIIPVKFFSCLELEPKS
jgi:hypothetical protein